MRNAIQTDAALTRSLRESGLKMLHVAVSPEAAVEKARRALKDSGFTYQREHGGVWAHDRSEGGGIGWRFATIVSDGTLAFIRGAINPWGQG